MVEKHKKYYRRRRASKGQMSLHNRRSHLAVVESRVRKVIVEEDFVVCSIQPELGVKFASIRIQQTLSMMVRLSF